MQRNSLMKLVYWCVTVLFLIIAFVFVDFSKLQMLPASWLDICIILGLFLAIHALKFFRMYVLLLEDMVPIADAIRLYAKTTFINSLIPYKVGEIYKVYAYGYYLKNFTRGILVVITEKIFDAIILCIILLMCMILSGSFSMLFLVLLVFISVITMSYLSFVPTHQYLNRFFITRGGGKKSLAALKVLSVAKNIFTEFRRMLIGRQFICFTLSLASWIVEILLLAKLFPHVFSALSVLEYVSSGFFGTENLSMEVYMSLCASVLFTITIFAYLYKALKLLRRNK